MFEFGVLGPLIVRRNREPLALNAPMLRRLLVLLLCRPGRPWPLASIVDVLWPARPPATARKTLQVYVGRLRKALGDEGRIRHGPGGYSIVVAADELDTVRFRALVDAARAAHQGGGPAAADGLLAEALGLWRGTPFANLDGADVFAEETLRLEELWRAAHELRAAVRLDLRRHHEVVADLAGWLTNHAYQERLIAYLMLALYRSDRQSEALDLYRHARTQLTEELGIEPGPTLSWLQRAILRSDSRLWQLSAADLDGRDTPPTTAVRPPHPHSPAAGAVPAQLPPDVGGFTGRTDDLATLDAVLTGIGAQPTAVVISAIAGTAGVGKTALAVHWAHRVRHRFPDGQLYVNLRGYDLREPLRPVAALTQLLLAMGVPAEQIPMDEDNAAGLYRSVLSSRRVLVLLDNAGSAGQVRPLLPGGEGSLVLVTSRDGLRGLVARDGARLLRLDVLSAAESGELICQLVGAERSGREPEAVARLAELCGHLPLALRIAAATLAARPAAALADLVAAIETGPLSGLRILGDPQSDLRAVFRPSYRVLPDADRRLFRLLGLIPGPDFGAATAAALADIDVEQAAEGLDRLAEAHLVSYRGPGRFGLHDLLRAYAYELAQQDEADPTAARNRMYGYYLGHVDTAARLLYPRLLRLDGGPGVSAEFPSGPVAVAWLDAELRGLVDAVQSAAGHGRPEIAWLLADGLRGYLALRSRYVDWLTVAEAALAAASEVGDDRACATARLSLGMLAQATGDFTGAAAHYREALRLAQVSGWRTAEGAAEHNLGGVLADLGHLNEATRLVRRTRALERRLTGRVSATNRLSDGVLRLWLGRLRQATDLLGEAAAEARQLDNRDDLAAALQMLGYARHLRGQFDQALEALDEAHAIFDGLGNSGRVAFVEASQALVHLDADRLDLALSLANRARIALHQLGRRFYESFSLTGLAAVEAARGDHTAAEPHLTAALALAHQVGSSTAEATARLGLADLYHRIRRPAAAAEQAQQALTIARQHGFEVSAGQALGTLAEIHLSMMDTRRAVEYAQKALASHRKSGHLPGAIRARTVLVRARRTMSTDLLDRSGTVAGVVGRSRG